MKKLLLTVLFLTSLIAGAQERKWEHRIYVGAGLMNECAEGYSGSGLALKAGYGLRYFCAEQWSLTAGVTLRDVTENAFKNTLEGADDDHFTFLDVPAIAQYHVGRGKGSWSLGLGPVFSFCIANEHYYVDADPDSPLNQLDKCKKFAFGLQPSITYQLSRRWEIGIEANIGLTNIENTHNLTIGSKHLHDVTATIGIVL